MLTWTLTIKYIVFFKLHDEIQLICIVHSGRGHFTLVMVCNFFDSMHFFPDGCLSVNPEDRLTINNVLERLAAIAESNNVNLKQPLKFERKKVEQSVATSSPGNKKSSKYYTTISWNEMSRRGTSNPLCDQNNRLFQLICVRAYQLSTHLIGPSLCSVAFQSRAKTGQAFFDFLHSNFVFSKYLFWIEFLRDVIFTMWDFVTFQCWLSPKNEQHQR